MILGLDVPAGTVDQAKIKTLKLSMVNSWCTDPTQRQVLNQVNIAKRECLWRR